MNGRFTETNARGVVLVCDKQTDLIWQKDYATNKTWQQAMDYADELNTAKHGGYSDWRLPTIEELVTLINYQRYNPASDFPGMPNGWFWSSSSYAGSTSYAWNVYGSNGSVSYCDKTYGDAARCVRGERR
jgi:hypothetical protein